MSDVSYKVVLVLLSLSLIAQIVRPSRGKSVLELCGKGYAIIINDKPHTFIDGEEVDVKTFQTELGIDADGNVGPKTIKAAMVSNSIKESKDE